MIILFRSIVERAGNIDWRGQNWKKFGWNVLWLKRLQRNILTNSKIYWNTLKYIDIHRHIWNMLKYIEWCSDWSGFKEIERRLIVQWIISDGLRWKLGFRMKLETLQLKCLRNWVGIWRECIDKTALVAQGFFHESCSKQSLDHEAESDKSWLGLFLDANREEFYSRILEFQKPQMIWLLIRRGFMVERTA